MIKNIEEIDFNSKRVFVRVDFNVPLDENQNITDDTRIQEALPTIQFLIEKNAKIILGSHLGRPEGNDPKLSLEPIASHLTSLLAKTGHSKKPTEVTFLDDCVGDGVEMVLKHVKTSQIVLLENLRFHKEEEANDLEFSKSLASLADIYITDAFGTAHRKHASTYGVPSIMPIRTYGFLIAKELKFLNRLLDKPEQPFVAILGGSKVSDKIKTIDNLFKGINVMLIGGAMAHAFRLAQGGYTLPPGSKTPKPEDIENAKSLFTKAKEKNIRLLIPTDDNQGFDIGPKTIQTYCAEISKAKTVFWNGPVGMFEKPEFSKGSFALAEAIANSEAVKVIGGGDTVSAVHQSGFASKMDHISTGGGATLEYLEGNGLSGITVLHDYSKPKGSFL